MATDNYFCKKCGKPLSSVMQVYCSKCRQEANKEATQALVDAIQGPLIKQLEALTPGGSEFHNDSERCLEWIKDRLETTAKIAGERNELRERVRELEGEITVRDNLVKNAGKDIKMWMDKAEQAEAETATLKKEVENIGAALEANQKSWFEMEAEAGAMRKALEKLAKLGAEPRYGNSIGNVIAQDALAASDAGRTYAEEMARLRECLKRVQSLMSDSRGVDGYHLNGNIATWDELEEWLGVNKALVGPKEGKDHETL